MSAPACKALCRHRSEGADRHAFRTMKNSSLESRCPPASAVFKRNSARTRSFGIEIGKVEPEKRTWV
eukprot:3786836-Rhodomonas_salina.3